MQKAGRGKIVLISSIAGIRGGLEELGGEVGEEVPGWWMDARTLRGIQQPSHRRMWVPPLLRSPAGAGTQIAYACSKGALLPMARSLAAAWGKDNIQVGGGRGN